MEKVIKLLNWLALTLTVIWVGLVLVLNYKDDVVTLIYPIGGMNIIINGALLAQSIMLMPNKKDTKQYIFHIIINAVLIAVTMIISHR